MKCTRYYLFNFLFVLLKH